MTQHGTLPSCNSAEISLLRHHADKGRVAEGGPPTLSTDALKAVLEGLRAKGMVDGGGRYTPSAWSTLWSELPQGRRAGSAT